MASSTRTFSVVPIRKRSATTSSTFTATFAKTHTINFVITGNVYNEQMGIPGTGIEATPYSGVQTSAITTATTTQVKTGAGVLGTLINGLAGASGTVTIYDNTSATGKVLLSLTSMTQGQVIPLGIPFSIGLCIVTVGSQDTIVAYA